MTNCRHLIYSYTDICGLCGMTGYQIAKEILKCEKCSARLTPLDNDGMCLTCYLKSRPMLEQPMPTLDNVTFNNTGNAVKRTGYVQSKPKLQWECSNCGDTRLNSDGYGTWGCRSWDCGKVWPKQTIKEIMATKNQTPILPPCKCGICIDCQTEAAYNVKPNAEDEWVKEVEGIWRRKTKCECGAEAANEGRETGAHSSYCPRFQDPNG